MKLSKIFIYALINPLTNDIFYVGATKNTRSRLIQHISESKRINTTKSKIILSLLNKGLFPNLVVLKECTPQKASHYENFYIELFKGLGCSLTQFQRSNYSRIYDIRSNSELIKGSWYK